MTEAVPTKQAEPARTRGKLSLQTWAIILSSLVIPFPILISRLVEAILDSSNPANVDVGQELAYLRELLGFGFGALGVLLVVIVIVFVMIYRREGTLDALKLPLLLVAIQIVVGVAILLLTGVVAGAEDA